MVDETANDIPELAPFDPTKKKKKKKVLAQDPAEEVDKLAEKTEDLSVADVGEPSFVGMKKKKKELVETDFLENENGDAGEDGSGEQFGEDEQGEGIVLGGTRYPWEARESKIPLQH